MLGILTKVILGDGTRRGRIAQRLVAARVGAADTRVQKCHLNLNDERANDVNGRTATHSRRHDSVGVVRAHVEMVNRALLLEDAWGVELCAGREA